MAKNSENLKDGGGGGGWTDLENLFRPVLFGCILRAKSESRDNIPFGVNSKNAWRETHCLQSQILSDQAGKDHYSLS